jgi:hypothetical protein
MRAWTKVAFITAAISLFAEDSKSADIAKIVPEPVIVHIRHGEGAQSIVFLKSAGAPIPNVDISDAPGAFNVIPKGEITAKVEGTAGEPLFRVDIQVSTKQPITRGTTHSGLLLLSPSSAKEATPLQVQFAIQDDGAVGAEVLQTSLDTVTGWGEPDSVTPILRNTGNVAIDKVTIASSWLTDATTRDGYSLTSRDVNLRDGQIEPYQERTISFNVGQPKIAGIFVGDIYITLNGEKTVKLPITIRSRGPFAQYGLPLILFFLVVGLGFCLSSLLNSWFSGGGLERAQGELSLHNARAELASHDTRLRRWLASVATNTPPPLAPRAQLRLQEYLSEIDIELAKWAERTPAELTSKIEYFASAVSISDIFWSVLSLAAANWAANPSQLVTVIKAIDDVVPMTSAAGVPAYQAAINTAISNTAVTLGVPKDRAPSVQQGMTKWDPESIKKRIKRMARIYGTAVFVTVLATAYQSFYARNLGFGTMSDYIVVILWSLGLTATGTQILSRIHK